MKDPLNLKFESYRITFVGYFKALETSLGLIQIPLDKFAKSPKTIVKNDGLFGSLPQQVAVDIFKNNRCRTMRSPIYLFPTLDALGALHWDLEDKKNADKATLDFLESIGEATISILEAN